MKEVILYTGKKGTETAIKNSIIFLIALSMLILLLFVQFSRMRRGNFLNYHVKC